MHSSCAATRVVNSGLLEGAVPPSFRRGLAMAVLHVHQFDLQALECPVTWGSGHVPVEECEDMLDKLCLAPTPWAEVLERFRLAWSFWQNSRVGQARALVIECYMRLLPYPEFHQQCGLIKDYRCVHWVAVSHMKFHAWHVHSNFRVPDGVWLNPSAWHGYWREHTM